MTNSIPAVFGMNRYLWAKLTGAGLMDPADYNGLTPIVPFQEEAQLKQAVDAGPGIGSKPYIVYNYGNNGFDSRWFTPSDQVIYTIDSVDGKRLREIYQFINNLFKRYDESAEAVNRWIDSSDLGPEYRNIEYKSIQVFAATAGHYRDLENEPIHATITVRVLYTNTADAEPLW
jgi:hypothetical protein